MTANNENEELIDIFELEYERNDTEKTVAFFKQWIDNLNKFKEEIVKHKLERYELICTLAAKFEVDNYKELVEDILMSYAESGNNEYFELFNEIYKVVKWTDPHDTDILEKFTSYVFINTVFKNKNDNFIKLLKQEATPSLEFRGERISIEEYMEIAYQVSKMNQYITTKILFNDKAKEAIMLGLKTKEQIFDEAIKSYQETESVGQ